MLRRVVFAALVTLAACGGLPSGAALVRRA